MSNRRLTNFEFAERFSNALSKKRSENFIIRHSLIVCSIFKRSFAACFRQQANGTDFDVVRQGFAHVVNRQCGDRRARQGFHFDARFCRQAGGTIHDNFTFFIQKDGDLAVTARARDPKTS